MLDTTRTFFYGAATDQPNDGKKKPEQPRCAVNDLVYYYPPGERHGIIGTVTAYWRDDNGRIKVKVALTATGEEIETYQTNISQ